MQPFAPLGFLAFFAAMWTGVCFLISRLSGWAALSRRFPGAEPPPGERLTWTSAQFGGVSFRNCLNMTLGSEGLFLVPSLIFGLFMPPLLVPWREIRFEGFKTFFFVRFCCYRLGGEGPLLCVYGATAQRFRPFLLNADQKNFDAGLEFMGSLMDRRVRSVAWAAAAVGAAAALFAATAARR